MNTNRPTKLAPAPLGQGGNLQKMRSTQTNLLKLKQQKLDIEHQIKHMELRKSFRKGK